MIWARKIRLKSLIKLNQTLTLTILNSKNIKVHKINIKNNYLQQLSDKNQMFPGMMLQVYNRLRKLCNRQLYYQLNIRKCLLDKEAHGEVFYSMDLLEQVKLFLRKHVQHKWKVGHFSVSLLQI